MVIRRLPIRLKLTLVFALAMAVVLGATGLFVYLRVGSELDRGVDRNLRSRASDITALIKQADQGLAEAGRSPLGEQGEGFAQILDRRRHIVDSTPQVSRAPSLSPIEVARAGRATTLFTHGDTRLLATPVRAQDQQLVVVAGASTQNQSDALRNLLTQLLIGGAIALALASLAAYGLAAAALRPVESMRRRAAAISAGQPGHRLPVPPARDEISRLGDTLNAMLARLEDAFARERTFVADASHELRTPLAILTTELELALRRGRSPGELTAALRSAVEETDRLSQLAEDLLVLARSDHGRLPVSAVSMDVPSLLRRVEHRYKGHVAAAGRSIAIAPGDPPRLVADPARIEQALGNMVDNALRHGGGPIELGARGVDGEVELHVVDAGPGLPGGFLPSAFERFSRADGARTGGGTGLGLAIVASIAAAHGGSAGAVNRPGGGADVWIVLPAAS
jgi:heavy metal sensor kinase